MSGYSPIDKRELEQLAMLRLPQTAEDITEFREVPLADLPSIAEDLRHVPPPRTGWGRWRAVAHNFVYEMLEL